MTSRTTSTPAGAASHVAGERSVPLVARVLSRQAHLSNWLAIGLMLLLGVTTLGWYYGHQFARQAHSRQSRQASTATEAATEMALPPLGALATLAAAPVADTDNSAAAPPAAPATPRGALTLSPRAVNLPGPALSASLIPAALSPLLSAAPGGMSLPAVPPSSPAGGARQHTGPLQRRLQGDVYAGVPDAPPGAMAGATATGASNAGPGGPEPSSARPAPSQGPGTSAIFAGQLTAAGAVPVTARRLRGRSLLLSKGTFIDCTLETAIDSTLPGITTCVTASDTYSADGTVVLLERGTRLFGETQGQTQQGSARVYVLWTEARTPTGVVVPLESPGTDELGRAGLPGTVQRHFWERFGAAILLSTIDGAVQAAVQSSSSHDGGTVIYNPGATQDVMTEVLKSTVGIAPTVIKRNGDRIEVLVARDVNFAAVYSLRAIAAGE